MESGGLLKTKVDIEPLPFKKHGTPNICWTFVAFIYLVFVGSIASLLAYYYYYLNGQQMHLNMEIESLKSRISTCEKYCRPIYDTGQGESEDLLVEFINHSSFWKGLQGSALLLKDNAADGKDVMSPGSGGDSRYRRALSKAEMGLSNAEVYNLREAVSNLRRETFMLRDRYCV